MPVSLTVAAVYLHHLVRESATSSFPQLFYSKRGNQMSAANPKVIDIKDRSGITTQPLPGSEKI